MAVVAGCAIFVALGLGLVAGLVLAGHRRPTRAAAVGAGRRDVAAVPLAGQVVEMLRHGVVVVDRDERVVLVNPAARAMGVLTADRLAFDELTRLARAATGRRVAVAAAVDLPMGRLGREPTALSVTAVPLPDVSAVALLLDDVTESRRLEAVRRDFVANISHELKTPVGARQATAFEDRAGSGEPQVPGHRPRPGLQVRRLTSVGFGRTDRATRLIRPKPAGYGRRRAATVAGCSATRPRSRRSAHRRDSSS